MLLALIHSIVSVLRVHRKVNHNMVDRRMQALGASAVRTIPVVTPCSRRWGRLLLTLMMDRTLALSDQAKKRWIAANFWRSLPQQLHHCRRQGALELNF
jgi:hypothetical protein